MNTNRLAFWLFLCLAFPNAGFPSTTINNCTQAELETALAGGGTVVFACSGTITLTNTIRVEGHVTLDAAGYDVTLSGGGAVRHFQVGAQANLTLKGLNLVDGMDLGQTPAAPPPGEPGVAGRGGCILNLGRLALTDCVISNSFALGGDAIAAPPDVVMAPGGQGLGGALCNWGGQLSLTNCGLFGNEAMGGEGSPDTKHFIRGAEGGHGYGGAIYSADGSLYLDTVTFADNRATGSPGTLENASSGARGGDGAGGAFYLTNSTMEIHDSLIVSNSCIGAGTRYDSSEGGGDGLGGGGFLSGNATAQLLRCRLVGNSAAGGDIHRWSDAGDGRGGALFSLGQMEIIESVLSENRAQGGSSFGAGPGCGGAVCSEGELSITASTFKGNIASGGDRNIDSFGGTGNPGAGGAVWSSGALHVTNSTFVANLAEGGNTITEWPGDEGDGLGGAFHINGGTADLQYVTLDQNQVVGGTGSIASLVGAALGGNLSVTNGLVTLVNSIVNGSTNGPNMWGDILDGGYNLSSDGIPEFYAKGSFNDVDPLLEELADNGGFTPTIGLREESPARDKIPSTPVATDQRGQARPQGPASDIGAFEANPAMSAPTIAIHPQPVTVQQGETATFSVLSFGSHLTYQWLKDEVPLPGQQAPTLTIANAEPADEGVYSVAVGNAFGSTTSNEAALIVVASAPVLRIEISGDGQSVIVSFLAVGTRLYVFEETHDFHDWPTVQEILTPTTELIRMEVPISSGVSICYRLRLPAK